MPIYHSGTEDTEVIAKYKRAGGKTGMPPVHISAYYSRSLSNEVLSSLVNKGLKPLACTSPSMKVL